MQVIKKKKYFSQLDYVDQETKVLRYIRLHKHLYTKASTTIETLDCFRQYEDITSPEYGYSYHLVEKRLLSSGIKFTEVVIGFDFLHNCEVLVSA